MRSYVISLRLALILLLFCFVLLTACGQSSSPATGAKPTLTPTVALDMYGTPIVFPTTAPQRIVSLVPSASEILGTLHLQSRVVGVDYYDAQATWLPRMETRTFNNDEKGGLTCY